MTAVTDGHVVELTRVSDQVASYLRNQIFSQALEPRRRLIENEICAQLGISRAPLREAFLTLAREGLVEIRPRRGAIVADISPADLAEIAEVRAALEGLAIRKAMVEKRHRLLAELNERLELMRSAAAEHASAEELAGAHIEFHRVVARCAGLPRAQQFLDHLYSQSLALNAYRALPQGDLEEVVRAHADLFGQLRGTEDPLVAEQRLSEHILNPSKEIKRLITTGMEANTG